MPASKLIVLRAGIPPVRANKIVYWREKAFTSRVITPPIVPVHEGFARDDSPANPSGVSLSVHAPGAENPLTLEMIIPHLEAAGFEPLPDQDASDEAVEAWIERFIDASASPAITESDHAR